MAAPTVVVLLLFIGFFKNAPVMRQAPVDLTAICMTLVALGVLGHVILTQGRLRVRVWALGLVALLAPAAFYPITNPEVLEKRVKLLIPLLGVLGVCYLVRSARRQQVWVWLHVLVGVTLVATGVSAEDEATMRFTGAGSNTIGAGRASGVAILVLVILMFTGGLPRWWHKLFGAAVIIWLASALIDTGSRGPVFACAAAVLLVATLGRGRGRTVRALTALGALVAGWLLLSAETGLGATRITQSITGQYSLTGARSGMWVEAAQASLTHPLGIGWGNFWAVLTPAERLDSGYIQYPHNVVLEVLLEAGWLAGLAIAVYLAASLARLHRHSDSPHGAALLGIALFFVLNASVSGDVNDNRMMWVAVSIAWVCATPVRASSTPVSQLAGRRAELKQAGTHRVAQPPAARTGLVSLPLAPVPLAHDDGLRR